MVDLLPSLAARQQLIQDAVVHLSMDNSDQLINSNSYLDKVDELETMNSLKMPRFGPSALMVYLILTILIILVIIYLISLITQPGLCTNLINLELKGSINYLNEYILIVIFLNFTDPTLAWVKLSSLDNMSNVEGDCMVLISNPANQTCLHHGSHGSKWFRILILMSYLCLKSAYTFSITLTALIIIVRFMTR